MRNAARSGSTRTTAALGLALVLVMASPSVAGSRRTPAHRTPPERTTEFRSIDGSGNNPTDPTIGSVGTQLVRLAGSEYADGFSEMAGALRLSPRALSNLVNAQQGSIPNRHGASDYLWQWGQFLDHDLDLSNASDDPSEQADIAVPLGDPFFDPSGTGTAVIPFSRSTYDPATGSPALGPRQQLNQVTAWIDASNVYSSDDARARALRSDDDSGRLRTSDGDLLPFNDAQLPNAGGTSSALFLAGDVRANEQVGLTALHTLFVRDHNRWADLLAAEHPDWDGDRLYEKARQLVGAEMQIITYGEFLPALLGRDALAPYRGYDPDVEAGIANVFATAAYRFGHSALSPTLLRLDADGNEIPEGSLRLRDAFFAPFRITDEGGIEPLLRGLAAQACQRIDVQVVDDVRNFLFGSPGSGGFDLPSLNIQRGRDHGLQGYNALRKALGLSRARSFADVSSDRAIQARLAAAYANPDEIDPWIGGLAEDPRSGGHVGELIRTVLVDQFEALRDGDRFWYERALSRDEIRRVESLRLSDVIRLNTDIRDEIPDDVFHVRTARPDRRSHR